VKGETQGKGTGREEPAGDDGAAAVAEGDADIAAVVRRHRDSAEPAERALTEAYAGLSDDVEYSAAARDYERCLRRLADLAPVLDRFFVEVLVMDPDPEVRAHRIAMLRAIGRTLNRAARLAEVVVDRAEHRARSAGGGAA
jgi:glycyl-tRNA synthetase beta subunit